MGGASRAVERRRMGLMRPLSFQEARGASGNGQRGDRLAVSGELSSSFSLETGAVVAVGQEAFEAAEFGLFLRGALQGLFVGVVPPGAGFGEAHGAAGAGVGGHEQ